MITKLKTEIIVRVFSKRRQIAACVMFACCVSVLNGCVATIETEPPPPRVEVIGAAPAPGYVWIGGNWAWKGAWVWQAGRWEAPPSHDAVYIHGYWRHGSTGYSYMEGHWNKASRVENQPAEKRSDDERRMGDGR